MSSQCRAISVLLIGNPAQIDDRVPEYETRTVSYLGLGVVTPDQLWVVKTAGLGTHQATARARPDSHAARPGWCRSTCSSPAPCTAHSASARFSIRHRYTKSSLSHPHDGFTSWQVKQSRANDDIMETTAGPLNPCFLGIDRKPSIFN